jgi:hypothetical protein
VTGCVRFFLAVNDVGGISEDEFPIRPASSASNLDEWEIRPPKYRTL